MSTNCDDQIKSKSISDATLIIGKIPGYNSNIMGKKDKIDYQSKLSNNLTKILLSPTGYVINANFNVFSSENLKEEDLKNGESNELYKIGPNQKIPMISELDSTKTIKTKDAINSWHQIVCAASPNTVLSGGETRITKLQLQCTNDSVLTEVFANSFEMSNAEKLLNQVADNKPAQLLKNIKKGVTMSSTAGLAMMEELSNKIESSALSLLATKTLGIQSALPKEWFKSDYNNSMQLMIKLISPSGHYNDIMEFIYKPMHYLILAMSPSTFDGISFGYPPLWKVEADGLMDMQLAGIAAMTITRGGNETQFNKYNQPLNIDIRLTIEPLINGFATPIGKFMNNKNPLVSSPAMVETSFTRSYNEISKLSGNAIPKEYRTINLSS